MKKENAAPPAPAEATSLAAPQVEVPPLPGGGSWRLVDNVWQPADHVDDAGLAAAQSTTKE